MTSIIFVIGRIYRNQFNCNYLRNKNFFLNVLLQFWNLHHVLKKKKKEHKPHSLSSFEIIDYERRRNLNI